MAIFTFIFSLLAPENLPNRVSSKKFNFNFAFQGNSAAKKTPARNGHGEDQTERQVDITYAGLTDRLSLKSVIGT